MHQCINNIETTIKVTFTDTNWQFDDEQVTIDNPFFHLEKRVTFKDSVLTLYFDYSAKQDHIPADQIDLYLSERKNSITRPISSLNTAQIAQQPHQRMTKPTGIAFLF